MRRLFSFAVALTAMAGIAVGAPPSDKPADNPSAAKQDAKDTAKASKDAAKDTAKESKDAAKDSAQVSKEAAKDSASAAKEKETAKNEKNAAKDASKSAADSAKNAAKDTSKSASDTAKNAEKAAKGNASDTVKTADEVADDATDAAEDNADEVRDSARDTARDARESAQDTARDARDTARDARSSARDSARGAREGSRNAARDTRDTARDARDTARDTSRDARSRTRDAARDSDPDSRDARSTDRRDRRDSRENVRSSRDGRRSVEQLGIELGRVTDRGLTVSTLERDSVAYRAGLRESDIIISINGHDVRAVRDFDRYLYGGNRTERVEIIVWRDDNEEVIYFEPDVIWVDDVDTVRTSTAYDLEHFGVVLDDDYDDRIVIVKVYPDTPAYVAGLRAGDVITTWHGARISTPREFVRVIERAEPGTVKFEYMRNDRTVRADANLRRETFRNERAADRTERRVSRDAARGPAEIRTGEEVRQPVRGQTVPEASRDRQQDRREGTRPVVPGGGLLPRNR